MTGITTEVLEKLQAPFPIDAHELRDGGRDGKLVYLTEEPLIDRLIVVDPNWEFRITSTIVTDYNGSRPDCAVVTGELTICGVTRAGVGTLVANVKEYDGYGSNRKKLETPIIYPLSETEIKGAATDALKRCARQFGVGGYLLRTKGEKFNNENDFARWYNREFNGVAETPSQTRQNARSGSKPAQRSSSTPAPKNGAQNGDPKLDDITWTRDAKTLDNMVAWAVGFWTMEGDDPPSVEHVRNRICKALNLTSPVGNAGKFRAIMAAECKLAKDQVIDLLKAYTPSSLEATGS